MAVDQSALSHACSRGPSRPWGRMLAVSQGSRLILCCRASVIEPLAKPGNKADKRSARRQPCGGQTPEARAPRRTGGWAFGGRALATAAGSHAVESARWAAGGRQVVLSCPELCQGAALWGHRACWAPPMVGLPRLPRDREMPAGTHTISKPGPPARHMM